MGKKAEHIREHFGAFLKLAGVPFYFSLHFERQGSVDLVGHGGGSAEGQWIR